MNFFFSIKNDKLDCALTIPKFKNNTKIWKITIERLYKLLY